ncbi:hypothetical protein SynPROS91_01055 [Synechococcus sp. PROS-9-1]|nr:hypothetical protein SynPROS91_01055 [Synechococcus sp. PROS-9-1]
MSDCSRRADTQTLVIMRLCLWQRTQSPVAMIDAVYISSS